MQHFVLRRIKDSCMVSNEIVLDPLKILEKGLNSSLNRH